jgi:hypothetical protein
MQTEQCRWSLAEGWKPKPPGALGASAQLVLVFGGIGLAGAREGVETLGKVYPKAHRFGCSTAGEILGTELQDGTLAVTAVAFEHTEVAVGGVRIERPEGAFEAGAQAIASLPARGLRHAFVLAPGNLLLNGDLLSGINSALPAGATASGGFAGNGGNVHGSSVWHGEEAEASAVVSLGLYGDRLRVGRGVGGGWNPFGPERRVTKSVNEAIYEFDRFPALELYKQYLGEHAAALPFAALRFPVGLRERESDPWGVYVLTGIDEKNGSLSVDRRIAEGSSARFMLGSAEHLIEAAGAAARQSRDELGAPPQLAVLVSCYGRRVCLGERTEEELEIVNEAMDGATMAGFYSYGEISRHPCGAGAGLYNQTLTVTALAEV